MLECPIYLLEYDKLHQKRQEISTSLIDFLSGNHRFFVTFQVDSAKLS